MSVFFDPFTDNLKEILTNAEETQIFDWSIKSLTSGIDWTKCISEITLKSIFSDKNKETVIGNHSIYDSSNYVVNKILSLITAIGEDVGPITTDTDKLKDAAISLIRDNIFEQIRENDGFTDIGEDNTGNTLIEDRSDKLKQLLKANKILLDYKITDGVLLSNALTAISTKDYIEDVTAAMNELSIVNDGLIGSLMRRPNPYDDDTVGEFMDAATVRGLSSMVEFGARTAIGKMEYNNIQKHKHYFEARRAILMEYRSIIKNIPSYRNEHINELIGVLSEFGFDTLIQNLRQGVSLFDKTSIASAVGLSNEAIGILAVLYNCLDIAKTPEQIKIVMKMIGQIKVDLKIIDKAAIERGINGILKTIGISFGWVKRMMSKSEESDTLLARLEFIKKLMEDAV